MTKLHQLLAIEKGEKTRAQRELTEIHKASQKEDLYLGRNSTYRPFDEDSNDKQPDKNQLVQLRGEEVLESVRKSQSRLLDIIATRDVTNMHASAEVKVDGYALLGALPVTYLIYLEKTLNDYETEVRKMPTLPTNVAWTWDDNSNLFTTDSIKSYRTAKIDKVITKAEATREHPAQTEIRPADVTVGEWTTTHFAGSLTAKRRADILDRIVKLKEAVKFAREEANSIAVVETKVGETVFDYIFGNK